MQVTPLRSLCKVAVQRHCWHLTLQLLVQFKFSQLLFSNAERAFEIYENLQHSKISRYTVCWSVEYKTLRSWYEWRHPTMTGIVNIAPNGVLTAHTEWLLGVWLRHSVPLVQYIERIVRAGGCPTVVAQRQCTSWRVWVPATFLYFLLITSLFQHCLQPVLCKHQVNGLLRTCLLV